MDGNQSSLRAVFVLTVITSLSLLFSVTGTEGQTTSITSSGLGTTISPASIDPAGRPNYIITGGTRPGDGPNLFHSFADFNVGTNNVARFFNESGRATTNILSRVTGGQTSNIYGTIQAAGFGAAALWLINPAGIVFGPSASLNVGGSVHFSTADYLRLGSGNDRFYADLGKTSQLTSTPVTAFGFLGERPAGPITVQAGQQALSVSEGKAISLIGGDVSITGRTLSAPGGQINVASVKSAAEALLNPQGQSPGVDIVSVGQTRTGQQPTMTEGTVLIRGGALVGTVTLGNNAVLKTDAASGGKAGNIDIEANTLNMSPGTVVSAATNGSASDGNILIAATDQITISSAAVVSGRADSGGTANVTLTSPKGIISVTKGASINTNVDPLPNDPVQAASAGSVYIRAGRFNMDASMITSKSRGYHNLPPGFSPSLNPVKGGVIDVEAQMVALNNSALSTGVYISGFTYMGSDTVSKNYVSAGDVNLKANSLTANGLTLSTAADVFVFNSPRPGSITIHGLPGDNSEATSISLKSTQLKTNADTASMGGVAIGGTVQIVGRDIVLDNVGIDSTAASGGRITLLSSNSIRLSESGLTNSTNDGFGGSVLLRAGYGIDLTNTSLSSAALSADGGEIRVEAPSINISGGNISATASGSGRAGSVTVSGGNISLSNGALVSVDSRGTGGGVAGNIVLHGSNSIQLASGSILRSTSATASGGNILLVAPNIIRLQDSQITTSVTSSVGNGGNVTIDPPAVVLQNSQIHANALEGHGGIITIIGNVVLLDPASVLDASAGPAGVSGQINVQAPFQQLSGAIAPLPQAFAVATNLYGQRCATQKGGQFSSFLQGARDGVPPQPGDLIPSPLLLESGDTSMSFEPEGASDVSSALPTEQGQGVTPALGLLNPRAIHAQSWLSNLIFAPSIFHACR